MNELQEQESHRDLFLDVMATSYKNLDDVNQMIQAIYKSEAFQSDPFYVQAFGVDYILVGFDDENHSIMVQHITSQNVIWLPTTNEYMNMIRDCLYEYCYERKLIEVR